MNRIEELTLKLVDEALTPDESVELAALLVGNEEARQSHLTLLELEATLRGTRTISVATEATLRRLEAELFQGIERSVMERIRALPAPVAHPERSRRRKEVASSAKSSASSASSRRRLPGDSNEPSNVIVPLRSGARRFRQFKQVLAIAAVFALLVGLKIWLLPPVSNEPTLVLAPSSTVTIGRGIESFAARDQMKLQAGDVLNVSGTNTVSINFGEEPTVIAIHPGTDLKILAWTSGKHFELNRGRIEATVARQRPWQPMIWNTAHAEACVLGTTFTLSAATNATRLEVTEGRVKLTRTSEGEAVKVPAGHFAVAATNHELAALPLPGKVFREYWLDVPGDTLQDLTYHARYPLSPSGHDFPPNFETDTNWPSAFGTRARAYLLPPVSGDYEFRISGNGQMCLWLSPDEAPVDRVKIAQIVFTRNRPGNPGPETTSARQESGPIPLEAGRRYYIEAAHKYGSNEDKLTVTWKRPAGTQEPIPAEFLAPFVVEKKGAK